MTENTTIQHNNFDPSIFQVVDGLVNLTKIAKHFGRRLDKWKNSDSTKEYLIEYELQNPNTQNGQSGCLLIKKGGNGIQGTFAPREVALEFARWISPKFQVWANKQIDTLLQTGKVELKLNQNPITLPQTYLQALEALVEAEKTKEALQLKLEAQKDDVEFAQTLKASVNALPFDEAVKAMKLPYGRTTLFAKCRQLGFLNPRNHPYQEYIDRGYFQVLEYSWTKRNGDEICTTKTMITPKGQQWLLSKLN